MGHPGILFTKITSKSSHGSHRPLPQGAESHCSRASVAEPHLGHAHRQRLWKDIVGETWLKMLIHKKGKVWKKWPGIRCSRVVDSFFSNFCWFVMVSLLFFNCDFWWWWCGIFSVTSYLWHSYPGVEFLWLLGPSRQGPRWLSLWLYACLEVG